MSAFIWYIYIGCGHAQFLLQFLMKTGVPYQLLLTHRNVYIVFVLKNFYVPGKVQTVPESSLESRTSMDDKTGWTIWGFLSFSSYIINNLFSFAVDYLKTRITSLRSQYTKAIKLLKTQSDSLSTRRMRTLMKQRDLLGFLEPHIRKRSSKKEMVSL
jgi:hypothetical protein